MAIIKFNKENLIPSKVILGEAISVGILATLILFLFDFFGFQRILDFIPKGFEVLVLIIVSVYVKHLITFRLGGKELI